MKKNSLLMIVLTFSLSIGAQNKDRDYTVNLAYKISYPVLYNLSKGELKNKMPIEAHNPNDRTQFAHLEALGRTLCGIAPWLELGPDKSSEGIKRAELIILARKGIHNAFDPSSPDYMNFTKGTQPLVDAAFLAQSFLRAPTQLWEALDTQTKEMVIKGLKATRRIKPWYNNWLLFSATIEAFFLSIGEEDADMMRIDYALRMHYNWYKGDGIYGDGPDFHWDYYNSFVIQPMMADIAAAMLTKKKIGQKDYDMIYKRLVRYAAIQERLISPEGTFPPIGRSLAYRTGALQVLSQVAYLKLLPKEITPAQVRGALTAVMKRCFEAKGTFDHNGWLRIGLAGNQKNTGESYICTGSLYLCTTGFLHLGLLESDEFWSAPAQQWTSQKAWSGEEFPIDKAI